MKLSSFIALLAVIIVSASLWYAYSLNAPQTSPAPASPPSTAMGINGSPDQGNMGGSSGAAPQQPQSASSPGSFTVGTSGNSALGTYLVGANGMTLYTFAKDSAGTTTCYEQCAALWPPYVVSSGAQLNAQYGANGTVGTITRADGTAQVTYNGIPLYFYSGDASTFDTKGQGINGLWYVAKP